MTNKIVLVAALLASILPLQAALAEDEYTDASSLMADQPADVASFIDRRIACNYFLGEPADDQERAADIGRHLAELGCSTIDKDEAQLLSKHAADQRAVDAIMAARQLSY